MVSSDGKGRAEVWSAEASLNREDVDVPVDEGGGVDDVAETFVVIIDAVAMDNRERIRSSGYVVPAQKKSVETIARHVQHNQIGRTDRSNAGKSTTG
jgi:hypothetical protein